VTTRDDRRPADGPVEGVSALLRRVAAIVRPGGSNASSRPARDESDADRGEALAAAHLESCGCTIVARNLRIGHDEADLVAVVPPEREDDPPVLAIVEVKTSRTLHAPPHLRIDAGKRRRLVRLAERLIARDELADAFIRFDAVGVDLSRDPPAVEHLPACFDASSPIDRGGPRRHDRGAVG